MSTHANAPLTPEGRRRLWGVGKNAVTSRNRAAVARAKGRLRGLGVAPMLKAAISTPRWAVFSTNWRPNGTVKDDRLLHSAVAPKRFLRISAFGARRTSPIYSRLLVPNNRKHSMLVAPGMPSQGAYIFA